MRSVERRYSRGVNKRQSAHNCTQSTWSITFRPRAKIYIFTGDNVTQSFVRTIVMKKHNNAWTLMHETGEGPTVVEHVVCRVYGMRQQRERESQVDELITDMNHHARARFTKNSSSESTCVRSSSVCAVQPTTRRARRARAKEIDTAS